MKLKTIVLFLALLAILAPALPRIFAEDKKPDPVADLTAENKKLTATNAELVRSVQIVQQQRNQVVQQLLDTQAQVQLLTERSNALEAKVTELEKPKFELYQKK